LLEPQLPPVETGWVEPVGEVTGAVEDLETEATTDLERVVAGFVLALVAGLVPLAVADLLLLAEAEADLLTEAVADLVALAVAGFVLAVDDLVADLVLVADLDEETAPPRGVVEYHSETGIPKHSPTVTLRSPRF